MKNQKTKTEIIMDLITTDTEDENGKTNPSMMRKIRHMKHAGSNKGAIACLSKAVGRPYSPGKDSMAFYTVLPEAPDDESQEVYDAIFRAKDANDWNYKHKDFLFRSACVLAKYDDPDQSIRIPFERYLRNIYKNKNTSESMKNRIAALVGESDPEGVMKRSYLFLRMAEADGVKISCGKMLRDIAGWSEITQDTWARNIVSKNPDKGPDKSKNTIKENTEDVE